MKQAIILAAGEGQRLRPFTATRPKVMLGIAGKPILQYVIEALAQNGIRNIAIVVGYRREQVFDHFGNGEQLGVEITYLTQERQLGTAHALGHAKNTTAGDFLVLGGDNLIDAETIAGFITAPAPAMLLKQVPDASRYGVVSVEDNRVTGIVEKPANARGDRINTGIYAFGGDIFDLIGSELDIPDAVNAMLTRNCKVNAFETQGTWLDVVYPWDLVKLNGAVLTRTAARLGGTIEGGVTIKGAVSVGMDTVIRSNSYLVGPVVIGENCDIGPSVCIMPSTSIGDNVSIAPFTTIRNSVIGDDVSIGPASIIEDSVIDKGCVIRGHFIASSGAATVQVDEEHHKVNVGSMIGTACSLGSNVVAEAGSILGNYCQVEPMKVVRGSFLDRSRIF
jgi:UDP-N-acetylglucosamine diphosphorylase/glucosamine-1-phosphate N-acetyltransferase